MNAMGASLRKPFFDLGGPGAAVRSAARGHFTLFDSSPEEEPGAERCTAARDVPRSWRLDRPTAAGPTVPANRSPCLPSPLP